MLPWNYGFHPGLGTYIFLGAFYTVLVVIGTTVVNALWRSRNDLRKSRVEDIRWHSDFHDLAGVDRTCRHVLTGEFQKRECPNAFDCRECATHAKLVTLRPPAPAAESEVFGMNFPTGRYYHRGHTWAQPETDGTVTVGLDALGERLLGTPEAIELPTPGTQLHANGTAFRFRRGDADVRILSPVDGEVVETGGVDRGYFLRVKPPNGSADLRHLLSGAEIKPWMMRELERLQLAMSMEGARVPSLADGGVLVDDLAAACPKADWDAVCGQIFLTE